MKREHTPGPWRVKNTSEVVHGDTILIADAYGQYEQREANAKLMAAAPDMLEALQNVENDDGSIHDPIWKMIKNAIKKAIE